MARRTDCENPNLENEAKKANDSKGDVATVPAQIDDERPKGGVAAEANCGATKRVRKRK